MATTEDVTVGKLLLAEYDRVKEEQKTRIGFRDNLLYVTLAVTVTVLIGASQTHQAAVLLALPAATSILGWTYLANDQKISAIGNYIREHLGPRLGELAGQGASPFGWETVHRGDTRRKQRKIIQCAVDLTTFSGVPLAALAAFWIYGSGKPLTVTVSALEAIAIVVLATQITLYAETDS
ncbi:hypothetical protein GCM10010371_13850 [Streptomyces subrutilus]|uniref:Integral membrane protein n=1 Tax=Streptomyces subrutilus TaxID=36818 RepID=A0A5P2UKI3_9ACTN|nr:hypothetical protein [Streptomyces subrutilus]QEU78151.1 hypothetical protein CP968_07520 [Streptomyces subrutilus]GGZ55584.1 hypothetical protein GCM10010371_13850 [Streptomyces subrutilus]